MSEWWSVVALFWALYLADGVSGGRRERLFLSSWRGACAWRFWPRRRSKKSAAGVRRVQPARTATLTQAGWHFTPPWPWAWTLALEDLPGGLAAEGLTNWPGTSTARPPALPDHTGAVRWETVDKINTTGGWLTLGGRRFMPTTTALDAAGLRSLAERLGPMNPARRAKEIAMWQSRFFSVLRARRRLATGLARTRGLASLNTLQFTGWLLLSAALLGGVFDPAQPFGPLGSWRRLDPAQIKWWGLCGGLLFTHVVAVIAAWRLHRRLYPKLKDERANLFFSALLLPAQALRLRAALLRPLAQGMAPLAGALAAGKPATARNAAAATLRDSWHPIRPAGLPPEVVKLADEAAALVRPAVEQALADATAGDVAGLRPADLLAPPTDLERGVCAYCPRCGDGFVRLDGKCPQGVELRRI